jgi:hypothetical protein
MQLSAYPGPGPDVQPSQPPLTGHCKIASMPIGGNSQVCGDCMAVLNRTLSGIATLRHIYRNHRWEVSSHTFQQLRPLFSSQPNEKIASLAEVARIVQFLGDVEITSVRERPGEHESTVEEMKDWEESGEWCPERLRVWFLAEDLVLLSVVNPDSGEMARGGCCGSATGT